MSDHDHRLLGGLDQRVESLLHLVLTLCIQGTRSLVKQNDLGPADERSGDSDTLLLAAREAHTAFSHLGVEALWEEDGVLDKGERVSLAASLTQPLVDLGLARIAEVHTIQDIFLDAARE